MEPQRATKEQYEQLVQIGHPKLVGIDRIAEIYPYIVSALLWIGENKGLHLSIAPELYSDGINWNWQLLWYLPKEEWLIDEFEEDDASMEQFYRHVETGTFWFGDNHEYPTKPEAETEALSYALNKLIHGDEYALNNMKKYSNK